MFDTVLVADRGETACRIVRTCQRMGIRAVAVHSEADAKARHVAAADESVLLGPAAPAQSYLDQVKVLEAARQTGAQAIHPGCGVLAADAGFARLVLDAGLAWVGPAPEVLETLADPASARRAASAAGVQVGPGSADPVLDVEAALGAARDLGYPVVVFAAAGGERAGAQVAGDATAVRTAFGHVQSRGLRASGPTGVWLEPYRAGARHIAVPILGLPGGRVLALAEQECSVQLGFERVLEESPSPGVDAELRVALLAAARQVGTAVGYTNAGAVEFLVVDGRLAFLTANPRLPVAHPLTELRHDIDLVEQQLRIAAGEDVAANLEDPPVGHAVGLWVYAHDAAAGRSGPVRISRWQEPAGEGVRIDAGCRRGDLVNLSDDPLLAKVAVWGQDRTEALSRVRAALDAFVVEGPSVDLGLLAELLSTPELDQGSDDTGLAGRLRAPRGEATG